MTKEEAFARLDGVGDLQRNAGYGVEEEERVVFPCSAKEMKVMMAEEGKL